MNRLLNVLGVALVLFAGLSFAKPAKADAPFSKIVVIGDSLSDTGNVFLATGGAAVGPPYYQGRFSNGPVWVEVLAQELGLPKPGASLAGGTNYAWGGAETGSGLSFFGTPNVGTQIDFFLADSGGFEGNELIVVAAGSNDLISQAPFSPSQIAKNLADHVTRLADAGGQTFLVPNLAAIGETPLFRGTPNEPRLNELGTEVNRKLSKELGGLEDSLGITILSFDMRGVVDAMLLMPGEFGLSNVTDPACPGCAGFGASDPDAAIVPNPDEYLWWDFIHPTRVAHEIIGQAAADVVNIGVTNSEYATYDNFQFSAVPEPPSLALLAFVLLTIVSARRILRRRHENVRLNEEVLLNERVNIGIGHSPESEVQEQTASDMERAVIRSANGGAISRLIGGGERRRPFRQGNERVADHQTGTTESRRLLNKSLDNS